MNAILICPEYRPLGGQFHRMKPLALMPVMGRPLIHYTLGALARKGFNDVLVLASDRPAQVRQAVGDGAAWGVRVRVQPESVESDTQLAALEHAHEFASGTVDSVIVLDHCALVESEKLWQSAEGTFVAYRTALATGDAAAQLTMREVSPGVWISMKARVSSGATITGPAWIGPGASIREGARIGPHTIIEPGAFIDSDTVVQESWIGPDTYLGPAMNVCHSLAWGNGLTNWRTGAFLEVSDAFLMCDISRAPRSERRCSLVERVAAAALMVAALPAVLPVMIERHLRKQPVFRERRCILPPPEKISRFTRTYRLLTLEGMESLLQRWPELWRVLRGDMALIGNRPLSLEGASSLRGDWAQTWLRRPAGVFSLADAERINGECSTEALGYAAYYNARASWHLRLSILLRCLAAPITGPFSRNAGHCTTTPETV